MAEKEDLEARARKELKTNYAERLKQAFGENFEQHPAFQDIVREVARGRYANFAIADRLGI